MCQPDNWSSNSELWTCFLWLVPNLWTQGWPSGKSSPALSHLSVCHQGSLPRPMTNSCMTGEMSPQEIMVAHTDQKHLLMLYAFPVKEIRWANSRRRMSCCHTWLSGTLGIWTHFSSFCAKYFNDSTISLSPALRNSLKWYGRNMATTKLPVSWK